MRSLQTSLYSTAASVDIIAGRLGRKSGDKWLMNRKKYCTTSKELLAVVWFARQYKYYLSGRPFTIRRDHSSLTWLLRFNDPQRE